LILFLKGRSSGRPFLLSANQLCFAKILADRLLESPGLSLPLRRLSLNAKSNRMPGGEAPEPAFAGRMCLQRSRRMVETTRNYSVGAATLQDRNCESAEAGDRNYAARLS